MQRVCFVLIPRFQMLAYVLATETMRLANKVAGETRFAWETRTATCAPAAASNGAKIDPDRTDWSGVERYDLIVVCAGYNPLVSLSAGFRSFLARAARDGTMLGGFDTGSIVLAELGYLAGREAVLHYEAEAGFRERWPEIAVTDRIYSLDGDRLTAAGGTSAADAMLAWIAATENAGLAQETSDAMIHGKIRDSREHQRLPKSADPVLVGMQDIMTEHRSDPLSVPRIAERLGVTPKHLLGRCRRGLGTTPGKLYLRLRLEYALDLLRSTEMSVTDIAVAAGFDSLAGFSKAFRRLYGTAPRDMRVRGPHHHPGRQSKAAPGTEKC